MGAHPDRAGFGARAGRRGGRHDVGDRLRALHLEACRRAKPDGVALAGRLFVQVISNDYYPFPDVVHTYRDHFGASGWAEFRRLAEE